LKLQADLTKGKADSATLSRRTAVSDLSLSIGVEELSLQPWKSADTTLRYRIERSADLIRIQPSMPYLDVLDRGGPIDPLAYTYTPFTWDFPNLDFKIVNNGHRTIFLTEVCFAVESSQLDPSPVIVIKQDSYGGNARHFWLSNEGWGPLENLRVYFYLTPSQISPPETSLIHMRCTFHLSAMPSTLTSLLLSKTQALTSPVCPTSR
jgi:hypothetical protein